MSDEMDFSVFPSTKFEALTMLYLQKQDLGNISPKELAIKYNEVHKAIYDAFREISQRNRGTNL